jgi:putative tryptophan/tyrosine transport system substrate-binding protein
MRAEVNAMATQAQGRIFIAVRSAALVARVSMLALTVLVAMGGGPGRAQTATSPKRFGWLGSVGCPVPGAPSIAFVLPHRLAELGWIEGRDLIIDCISAAGRMDQAPALADELVARLPDVLFGVSTPVIRALKQATATIPIVTIASDPLRSGIVSNLAHPEGNVTGLAPMSFDLLAKRIELMKDLLPRLSRVALFYRKGGDAIDLQQMQNDTIAAAKALGFTWEIVYPTDAEDIDEIFARLAAEGFDAAYIWPGPFAYANRGRYAKMALQHRIPTISDTTEYAREGVLLSYGLDTNRLLVLAADYIDKLLRGAKPADLPLQQPTKFDLVINLKTAKALGLTIPQSILFRADELIE